MSEAVEPGTLITRISFGCPRCGEQIALAPEDAERLGLALLDHPEARAEHDCPHCGATIDDGWTAEQTERFGRGLLIAATRPTAELDVRGSG